MTVERPVGLHKDMEIGVIGIGAMGRPIAENLLNAGYSVMVYNRTLARAADLQSKGAFVAQRVSDACQADVVITMLADDSALESVVFQSEEFLPSFNADRIHVSMRRASCRQPHNDRTRFGSGLKPHSLEDSFMAATKSPTLINHTQ
jgi:hypothetical protein